MIENASPPRAVIVLLGAAAAVVAAAGLYAAAWLVGPVALALVVVIMVHPLHGRLRRAGIPGWIATTVLLLAIYGVLLVLSTVAVVAIARLVTLLPGYAAEANQIVSGITARAAAFGVGTEQLQAIASSLDARRLTALAAGLLMQVAGLAGNLIFLFSLLLFLGIESTAASARLDTVATARPAIATALRRFAHGTRRFLVVTTVVGLVTGVIDAVVLAALGVPLAVLWGLLVFITNYIPYIGFWIGFIPPVLLALLAGGPAMALAVSVVFVVVNFVLTSLVQPRFVGNAVGLSVSVTLVALVFWAWLLGPLGAVLAVPLTLLVKLLLVDVDPRARWLDALLGSVPTAPATAAGGPDTSPAGTDPAGHAERPGSHDSGAGSSAAADATTGTFDPVRPVPGVGQCDRPTSDPVTAVRPVDDGPQDRDARRP
ncbi:AI-2E family transporter [Pseudonocardia sp. NPDC049635]|uniref:AI-2E family transporter n=1 Tax=Pseudonocardia sp. NPDC049635 TaxID=3155506 RepID=UPI0033C1FF63